jgi:hypothetical protein
MAEASDARGLPAGPVTLTLVGLLILVAAGVSAGTDAPRGVSVACIFSGTPVTVIGVFWYLVASRIWKGVQSPWWSGNEREAGELAAVAKLVGSVGPDAGWASAAMQTATALHDDNVALCGRLDKVAYTLSWRSTGPIAGVSGPIGTMWRSLLDGRERFATLGTEMRGLAGRYLAHAPVASSPPDDQVLVDMSGLLDRIRALDAARRELEPVAGPKGVAPSGAQPHDCARIGAEACALLNARASELAGDAEPILVSARHAADKATQSVRRLQGEMAALPEETPAEDRAAFEATRRRPIADLSGFLERLHRAEEQVLAAAQELDTLPAPPPPVAPVFDRGSIDAADGMIAALREMRRRADEDRPST